MAKRPYFKLSIVELERIFKSTSRDTGTFEALQHELRFRKTQRASSLRNKVRKTLDELRRPESDASRVLGDESGEPSVPAAVGAPGCVPYLPADSRRQEGWGRTGKEPEAQSTGESVLACTATAEPLPRPAPDSILAAWLTLEVLTPQSLPDADELRSMGRQLVRLEEGPEPWTDSRSSKRGKERAVYWFLHLGEIDLGKATRSLLELFPDEYAEERSEVQGTTTMAVVVLDERGRPVSSKFFLSSFAWGYGQVRADALQNLANFPEAELRLRGELEKRLIRQDEDGEILPLTSRDVHAITAWLIRALNLPPEEVIPEGLAVRVPLRGYAREAPEPELLNSFFIQDLTRVRAAGRSGDVGRGLGCYLEGASGQPRQDVVRDRELLEETLAPDRLPLARWPVRGGYPLVLMQQAAVHHAISELLDRGLVGINGPPGTGKTTLLRDVVAKVVLDRAIALAKFEDPRKAFTHVARMRLGRAFCHLYRLDESLLGHEVVVASSNNKAVENISREVPAAEAVADRPSLRYLASIADCVVANGRDEEIVDGSAWGLAAAVLGNKANCKAFADSFWWHRQRGMAAYLRGIVEGWGAEVTDEENAPPEVLLRESAPHSESEALMRWTVARKDFLIKLDQAKAVASKLEAARTALQRFSSSEAGLRQGRTAIAAANSEVDQATRDVEVAAEQLEKALNVEKEAVEDRAVVFEIRPGFFSRLFRTKPYRDWRLQMVGAQKRVEQARAQKRAADRDHDAKSKTRSAVAQRLRDLEEELTVLRQEHAKLETTIAWAREATGGQLPDDKFWAQDNRRIQRHSPWLVKPLQKARDELFQATFALHRAFVDASARRLRFNLGAALAVMQGRSLTEAQEPARRSLWASLFLVVPVISTTFASAARLFGPLGREQLGWLLIDEAGQAVPQAAVGTMWRARRIVAIGDPLQIEPVVTVPPRLIAAIFRKFSVPAEDWAAPLTSVQTLADRASWFGTTILQDDGDLWVGSPLRVHRRCEEPMFAICNRIAYGGMMVQATPEIGSPLGDVLGQSRWIDVDGATVGKWSVQEGELAAAMLARVLNAGLADPDLFFITPFRIVAHNLRALLRSTSGIREKLLQSPWKWTQDRVGTIHTFQGKEAEAVVLVLGAPLEASAGARRWAGGSPNLLNVAVSRAKRRLYVVGSLRAWKDAGVFRILASALPCTNSDHGR